MAQVMWRQELYTTACSHKYKKQKQKTRPQQLKLGATPTNGDNPSRVVTRK